MMKLLTIPLCALLLLHSHLGQAAQFGHPFITHFFDYQYQAHDQNLCVNKAPSGVLFFCNGRGILRYDGTHWELLESVLFTSVYDFEFSQHSGRIYTGANNHLGYFAINALNEWAFTEFIFPNRPSFNHIARVARNSKGIFFLSESSLYFFDEKEADLKWYPIEQGLTYHASIIEDQLHVFDAKYGMRRLNLTTAEFEPVGGSTLVDKYVMFDVELGDGSWLLGTAGSGLFKYDGSLVTSFCPGMPCDYGFLLHGVLLPDGNVALASESNGVWIINPQGELLRHFNESSGLESNQVVGLEYDEQASLWLAYSGGVSQIIQPMALSVIDKNFGLNHVESVLPWQNKIYVGTRRELFEFSINEDGQLSKRLIDENIFVNDIDRIDNTLLISSGRALKQYSISEDKSSGTPSNTLIESSLPVYSQTLVSTVQFNTVYSSLGNKLYRLQKHQEQWTVSQKVYEVKEPIAKISELPSGELWLGSESQQVVHVKNASDWNNLQILRYDEQANLPDRFVFPHVIQDKVTFASPKGFFKFDSLTKQFVEDNQFLGSQNSEFEAFRLAHNQHQLVFRHLDGMGNVTLNGNSIDFQSHYLRYLGNSSTYSLELDGEVLWIGTTRGLFRVDQSQLYRVSPAPLLIEKVNSNSSTYFKGHLINAQKLPVLELAQKERELNIHTTEANYLPQTLTSFRVNLNGTQGSWNESQKYTLNVPSAGEHQLLLEQQFNEFITPFNVTIKLNSIPFWYETWLARNAVVGAVLILLILGLRVYTQWKLQRVEREKQELETVVEQRTATIKKQSGKLLALEQSRNKLLSNVSHEFRTPLSLILSPIELVIEKASLGQTFNNHLLTAKSNANRLLNLVNQILDINRIENADLPLKPEVHDFSLFLDQLLDNFLALAEKEHKVIDRKNIERNVLWEFDPYYMERIVFNLLANAFKFTEGGGKISIVLKLDESKLRLSIKDDGIGMNEEDRAKVFERFFQAEHQTTEFKPGTGIGLSLVKELVERHFGDILCHSELSVGTEFELRFDYTKPMLSVIEPDLAQSYLSVELGDNVDLGDGVAAETVGNQFISNEDEQKILLIVEDNDELRSFVANLFDNDFKVIKASNGKEGLELARARLPDIIVSDVMMPVMDGFELVDALNVDPELNFIPTILLTAKTNKIDTVKGLDKGADDYISKPFHNEELRARVNALLRHRERLKDHLRQQLLLDKETVSSEAEYINIFKQRFDVELDTHHEDFQLFLATLDIIRQHLSGEYLTVAYLSDQLNMDRSTLFRKLKNVLAVSPKQLIRDIRLFESLILLENKQGSISEVAYAVGFNCLSYFTKCFKTRFDQTPSEYVNSA